MRWIPNLAVAGVAIGFTMSGELCRPLEIAAWADETPKTPAVDYSRQIKPLFQRYCYDCHAGKKPASGYRVDTGALSIRGGDRGVSVVAGKSAESILFQALIGKGDVARMPQDSEPLPAEDIELVRRWIDEGGKVPENEVVEIEKEESLQHWAFQPVKRPRIPEVSGNAGVENPIDRFVQSRLKTENLKPSPEAERSTLIRRLSLDLRGFPPSPDEIEEYESDALPAAYDRLVDRFLASPHFGERWGRQWLDMARYADSNGFTIDSARSIWKYRDWVISALNADMPFDQFSVEQLAGDMLPDRTTDQLIATGFHRNTLINEEGGTDQEQFRVEAMVDRVSTTGSVWLGLTVGCAQCHEHKYDPISQREFYEMFALLNQCDEPKIQVPTPEQSQKLQALNAEIASAEKKLAALDAELLKGYAAWEQTTLASANAESPWTVLGNPVLKSEKGSVLGTQADQSIFVDFSTPPNDVFVVTADVDLPEITAIRLEALTNSSLPMNGPGRAENGNFVLSEFELRAGPKSAGEEKKKLLKPVKLAKAVADHAQEGYLAAYAIDGKKNTGWSIGVKEGSLNVNRELIVIPAEPVKNAGGCQISITLRQDHPDPKFLLGQFRLSVSGAPAGSLSTPVAVRALMKKPVDKRTAAEKKQLESAYLEGVAERKPELERLGDLKKNHEQLVKEIPTTLVLEERKSPRETRIMIRGDFLRTGAKVSGGVPAFLPPLKSASEQPNRLEFARWLVTPKNPLTARVTVNRIWQQLFGTGIVATENDFGLQASAPSHPELLDWLASEFSESSLGSLPWSQKSLIRTIVTSATYRQSSRVSVEHQQMDPANRYLARQARIRLEAEIVRDCALEASGLLTRKLGGPSVYPPQPEGIYVLTQVKKAWPESQGPDRYRRGMYTYYWRSSPYPLMPTFDAPDANMACTRRTRSNTPLQALTLANDRTFMEFAKALGGRMLREAPSYDEGRIRYGFKAALSREPNADEMKRLQEFVGQQRAKFSGSEKDATVNAPTELPEGISAAEGATWTAVARVLLNVDEFITRD